MNRKEEPAWSMKLTRLVRFSIRINMDCLPFIDPKKLIDLTGQLAHLIQRN